MSSNDGEDVLVNDDRRCTEGRAAIARAVDLAVEASRHTKPVHGVREKPTPIASKFWSHSGDSDSNVSVDDDLSTPEFINRAASAGFTLDQLYKDEKALDSGNSDPLSSDIFLAKSIVSNLVQRKFNGAPWKGPLPPPRVSPPRTLGDAMAKVAYQRSSSRQRKGMMTIETLPTNDVVCADHGRSLSSERPSLGGKEMTGSFF
jgi:hypothetical protein